MSLPAYLARHRSILVPAALFVILASAAAGYIFFRSAPGQMRLSGEAFFAQETIQASMPGIVSQIEVMQGQQISKGQILLRFGSGPLQRVFEQEQQKLAELTGMLPPQYVFLLDPERPDSPPESLTERLERQRAEETVAEQGMQEASLDEAGLAVTHNRIRMLVAQGKLSPEQQKISEQSLSATKEKAFLAKKRFEAYSLKRSNTDAQIRRLRQAQAASGADRIPLQERLRRFEEQRHTVAELAGRVQNAVVTAPFDGVIQDVLISPGDTIQSMQPCFTMRRKGAQVIVRATVPDKEKYALKKGLACEIYLEGHESKPVQGYISMLTEGSPENTNTLTLECTPLQPSELTNLGAGRTAPRPLHAELTVFLDTVARQSSSLNSQEYSVVPEDGNVDTSAASTSTRGMATGRIGASGSALSDFAPQRENEAKGNGEAASFQRSVPEAPVIKAGSPEATGKPRDPQTQGFGLTEKRTMEPVQLPPMKAPYPLKGSPLPDVHNNPSIVPPTVLEPAPTRP